MDIFLLWLFAQANVIHQGLVGLAVLLSLGAGMVFLWCGLEQASPMAEHRSSGVNDMLRKGKKRSKRVFIIGCVCAILAVAVPDRTGLAIIIGGKLSLDAIQSEEASETAGKLYELVNRELDQRLEETEPGESE